MNEQRKKSLDSTLLQIEKQFGKGAIMRLGDDTSIRSQGVISSGSIMGQIHGFDVFLDQNIVGTTDGFRHNLAFVRDPSGSGLAGAVNGAAIAWAVSPLSAPVAGAVSSGNAPRITFSYDAKGNGSDVIDSRIQYGDASCRVVERHQDRRLKPEGRVTPPPRLLA